MGRTRKKKGKKGLSEEIKAYLDAVGQVELLLAKGADELAMNDILEADLRVLMDGYKSAVFEKVREAEVGVEEKEGA